MSRNCTHIKKQNIQGHIIQTQCICKENINNKRTNITLAYANMYNSIYIYNKVFYNVLRDSVRVRWLGSFWLTTRLSFSDRFARTLVPRGKIKSVESVVWTAHLKMPKICQNVGKHCHHDHPWDSWMVSNVFNIYIYVFHFHREAILFPRCWAGGCRCRRGCRCHRGCGLGGCEQFKDSLQHYGTTYILLKDYWTIACSTSPLSGRNTALSRKNWIKHVYYWTAPFPKHIDVAWSTTTLSSNE